MNEYGKKLTVDAADFSGKVFLRFPGGREIEVSSTDMGW